MYFSLPFRLVSLGIETETETETETLTWSFMGSQLGTSVVTEKMARHTICNCREAGNLEIKNTIVLDVWTIR